MVKAPLKIFVSYRQSDSAPEVHLLSACLKEAFGRLMVFVDRENIRPGPKWPPQIEQELETAGVLLVVVGPNWLNEENRNRLTEDNDWVRREIARSIERDIKIIPIRINGAQRPDPKMLPPSISGLDWRQTMPLASENWKAHIFELEEALVAAGCRRLPTRIILMDSHTKIYGRKENRYPAEMNSHVIRRELEMLPGQAIEIEPVNSRWQGECGIKRRNPSLIIIHYSCLDEGRKSQRLRQFLGWILSKCPDVEVIVYSRTKLDRSTKYTERFDEDIKSVVPEFRDRLHGLPVYSPKAKRGQKREGQTFDDPETARDLRTLVKEVLAIVD